MTIHSLFPPYNLPAKALPVRCHVLTPTEIKALEDFLVGQLPWCYIKKSDLLERVKKTGLSISEILGAKFPDPGSVMSGDFGEILALFFISSEQAERVQRVRKWRYKQDRKKPAPHSDVVILHRSSTSKPTAKDFVICSEVKQKSTATAFCPISMALKGFEEDKTGRLARTLTWLKEQAVLHESTERISFIRRFTDDLSISYLKKFKAVAVVDNKLLNDEITKSIKIPSQTASFEILVLGVPELKPLYERVFARAGLETILE